MNDDIELFNKILKKFELIDNLNITYNIYYNDDKDFDIFNEDDYNILDCNNVPIDIDFNIYDFKTCTELNNYFKLYNIDYIDMNIYKNNKQLGTIYIYTSLFDLSYNLRQLCDICC